MANKNILVSSNGKYEPISASVDDVTGVLSSSLPVTANTASFAGQSGLMQVYGGKLMSVGNTSINPPSDGIYSGSVLTYNNSEGFAPSRTSVASFSGDTSGDTISGVKVRSVSNVTGGLLPLAYGGTGTGSFDTDSLVTTSGSGLAPSAPNKIVVAASSNYISGDTALLNFSSANSVIAYLYTGSLGSNNDKVWTKPSGCRFVTIICQGGGASGEYAIASPRRSGLGGGGGGFSYCTLNALSLPNAINIRAGGGGNLGGGGGNSYFENYIIAYGGAINSGGAGNIENGANGGSSSSSNTVTGGAGGSTVFAGAGGGGGGASAAGSSSRGGAGGSVSSRSASGTAGGATPGVSAANTVEVFYKINNIKNVLLDGTTLTNLIPLFSGAGGGGGGGGSSAPRNGGNAQWGSGGGGAGYYFSSPTFRSGTPGTGGKGYVLIICY
jgi:hypothetical protein